MSAAPEQTDTLRALVSLCEQLASVTRQLAAAEDRVKTLKRQQEQIAREDIPGVMQELGVAQLQLDDGSIIKLNSKFTCGITAERKHAAHQWLIERGFGGLIRTRVVADFGRGEREAAVAAAQSMGHDAVVEESVHPQTLASFLRERLAAGDAVPTELFGYFPFMEATVSNKR